MSTTIYNGYVTNNTNMAEILKKLINFRKVVANRKNELVNYYMSGHIEKVRSGKLEVHEFIKSAKTLFDFSFDIVLFPEDTRILLLEFGGRPYENIMPELIEKLNLKEYGYWDNTDMPDDVTNEEWEQRKKDWKKVFESSWIASECGFTFELSKNEIDYCEIINILK